MNKDLKCIMLVDDNPGFHYLHRMEIKKIKSQCNVIQKETGLGAIQYIVANKKNPEMLPDLIFLDINMPVMDGWEFLDSFEKLDPDLKEPVIIMLSTSNNPDDIAKSKGYTSVSDYFEKPLTENMMADIIRKHFQISEEAQLVESINLSAALPVTNRYHGRFI